MEDCNYKNKLKKGNSLEVFCNNLLIFQSSGKWLMPLFQLESLFKEKQFSGKLSIHDTIIGKAAIVFMIRLGLKNIHGNIVSKLAVETVEYYNKSCKLEDRIIFTYENCVERILCATEAEFSEENDFDKIYFRLCQRAGKTNGVSVKVSNLNYDFGNITGLSFQLEPGSHLMIIGENGTGKTTLLRLLAGIYKQKSGEILIDNMNINKLKKYTIGYIPQQTENNNFSISVKEIVGLGINKNYKKNITYNYPKKNKKEIIIDALKKTSSLHLIDRNYESLSGGEKQKVSLSRCLAQNAKLLLLDEPTAYLDEENRKMVIDIIRTLTVSEMPTIIISTHDKELIKMTGWKKLNLGGCLHG